MIQANTFIHRVCRRCRTSYSTEVPDVLRGGEAWPSRCPICGRLELKRLEPEDIRKIGESADARSPGQSFDKP